MGVGRWLAMASTPPVGEMLRRVLRILRRGLTPRTAVGAAGIVAGGFIASRLLGLLRSVAIAEAFGTEPELGAYWVAFRLPDTIFQLLAGATLSAAFIPTFSRVVLRESEDEGWWLASSVLNLIAIATFVAAAIGFLLAPLVVPLLAPGLGEASGREAELSALAVELTRLMLISPLLFGISGMLTAFLTRGSTSSPRRSRRCSTTSGSSSAPSCWRSAGACTASPGAW